MITLDPKPKLPFKHIVTGYLVRPDNRIIVMVTRDDSMPFVTYEYGPVDGGCYHGNYFSSREKATIDFARRGGGGSARED